MIDAARFWSKVDKTDACWLWRGSFRPNGYGVIQCGGRKAPVRFGAHVAAFILSRGRKPNGMVRHICNVRACVNPDHLAEGTHADNMRDREESGRTARGEKSAKKLNAAKVAEIRKLRDEGLTLREIAERFGVSRPMVGYIVRGTWWRTS